jgi:hypothetical protein
MMRQVNHVRGDVAERPGAPDIGREVPPVVRQCRVHQEVLDVGAAEMDDLAELVGSDDLAGGCVAVF